MQLTSNISYRISTYCLLLCLLLGGFVALGQKKDTQKFYELRTYHCNEDKRPDLIARFQNHTTKLFEKHGMENIGYWIATDNPNDLIYILAYPSQAARDAAWKAFSDDPEWKKVYTESHKNGALVQSVDSQYMTLNPELTKKIPRKAVTPERLFELRTYYCYPGRFPNIVARFRDHTRKLFEKHGMTNIAYWQTVEESGAQPKLVYIVAHKDADEAKSSWDAFRNDPEWKRVSEESQRDGKIVEKVVSVYMSPLPFSKIR